MPSIIEICQRVASALPTRTLYFRTQLSPCIQDTLASIATNIYADDQLDRQGEPQLWYRTLLDSPLRCFLELDTSQHPAMN